MRPLSPLKFFVENKKRTLVIVIILVLSVAVVSFITSLVGSIIKDVLNANLKPYEYTSTVSRNPDELFIKDEVVEKITAFPETDKVIPVIEDMTMFQALMGATSVPFYFITDEGELQQMMEIYHLVLAEGRLPAGDAFEVVLHENLLRNKKLSIGDDFGSDVQEDEWMKGQYKIVGTLQGDSLIGLGGKSRVAETYLNAGLSMDQPMSLIVVPKPGQLDSLNEKLDQLDSKETTVTNYTSLKRMIDNQIASMNVILQIIIFVVVFILSISVGALVFIIYMGRSDEFGILFAIGYRKAFIKNLIIKELAALSSVSWVLGYVISMGMMYALNFFYLNGKGQGLYFFTSQGLINTLFIPVMVLICAAYPILRKLKKWDPIAVIERRE